MQSHVCRNQPKLASARKVNKKLASSIINPLRHRGASVQWMTQTAAEFNRLTDLLVKHSSRDGRGIPPPTLPCLPIRSTSSPPF